MQAAPVALNILGLATDVRESSRAVQSREKDVRRLARRLHLVSDDDEPRCR